MSYASPAPLPEHVDAVVVGGGFAGIAAAIRLATSGRRYVLLERADDLAGTWRDNSYPGCACDVPSHLYSYSFAPNPDWSRAFSPQPEIYAYLRRVADSHGVYDHTWLGAEVTAADWDDARQRWAVRSTAGEVTADALVVATGGLSEPSVPKLPGLETFNGTTFHSAAWNHDYDLRGKRVACIGTGASAIQFVPEVAKLAKHVTVFQRTAPWVLPRRDRAITRPERWLFRHVPGAQKIARDAIYWGRESWILGFRNPDLMKQVEKRARAFIARQITDPVLRRKVTPEFRIGCKRVLLSNTWYPTLAQPHVDVETDRIVEVTPAGVVTVDTDGNRREHEVDAIVFGTGFHVTDPPIAHRLRGRDGNTLAHRWAHSGMSALHGLTVSGFPNLFFLVGPNTGLGHTSIVFMIETQVDYMVRLLDAMAAEGATTLEPCQQAQQEYNARLQKKLAGTVWNAGGCASWYLDEAGRNTTLWPTFTFSFRRQLAHVDLEEYDVTTGTPERATTPA